ncbi:OmpA family protein [Pseudomonas sp. FP198]|jgi:outer membrane protein OmpA-like peptidoglycan-associated protein|uniref:OmpA family protein n=1 Tax=Pseudomonas sp. FP198 TaxID=2954084 RepID=UPI002736AECF|nr:OmpA family protein [Pseudomonas sp. FP198]WLG97025.1 OmpA family protein [Pseudomonas sp. FP198]
MSSNKTLALALCFAITGCAQNPQNDAEGGGGWWPFGSSDKVASKDAATPAPLKPAAEAPQAKAEGATHWWWPFSSDESAADDVAKKEPLKPEAKAPAVAKAEAESNGKWWWPFGGKEQETAKAVPMPDPKVTQAWLDDYEPKLRTAIKDSKLELERRDNVLVVTAPADGSFNPDRPAMLLPVTLGPFTRVAKILEADPKTAVLILGHADTSGAAPANLKLSQERAQSVAAIFRLSGLQRDRLMLRGMGSVAPRAANDSVEGRALNRRVELLVTPANTMVALLSKYNMPAPAPVTMVAAQDVKPAAPAPVPATKKAAAPAAKKAAAKKAPAKAVAKAPAKKTPAKKATPAKKPEPAKAAADGKKVAAADTAKQ